MSVGFNADDIFAMAEQIELNGARFYRKVAEGAATDAARGMFADLAVMEDGHVKAFAAMRAALPEAARQTMVYDPEGESAEYLRAMADGYVFDVRTDPSSLLTGRESVAEVLRMAIGREKDSVVFYVAMKTMVPPDAGQAQLERIIGEELGHITLLSKQLANER